MFSFCWLQSWNEIAPKRQYVYSWLFLSTSPISSEIGERDKFFVNKAFYFVISRHTEKKFARGCEARIATK